MRLSNQDQHLGSMKQEKQGPYPRVLVIWERRLFDWVLSSWPWAYVHLGQVSLPLTVPLWLMPSIEAAGAGTVYIWKARPVFVQMLLILSHMRQELKAPRPRSWVTVALIGGERDNGQWSATFRANGRSCGFFKMTPTHNTFFPSLHNFFLHNIYAMTSGELLGLEPGSLSRTPCTGWSHRLWLVCCYLAFCPIGSWDHAKKHMWTGQGNVPSGRLTYTGDTTS